MRYARWITLAFVPLFMLLVAGCNTIKGAGQDLQAGGKSIANAAENHGAK